MAKCTLCEHLGKETTCTSLSREYIYNKRTQKEVPLILCRTHSVELFKNGTVKMCVRYAPEILSTIIGTSNREFINVLYDTFNENSHLYY